MTKSVEELRALLVGKTWADILGTSPTVRSDFYGSWVMLKGIKFTTKYGMFLKNFYVVVCAEDQFVVMIPVHEDTSRKNDQLPYLTPDGRFMSLIQMIHRLDFWTRGCRDIYLVQRNSQKIFSINEEVLSYVDYGRQYQPQPVLSESHGAI